MQPDNSNYLKGSLYGLAAVPIMAGWSVMTRLAVTTRLDAWDVTTLRFGIASVFLLPVILRRGLALDRLGWGGLLLLVAGGGAPYVMLAAAGLKFAPAYDQAALNPGCTPLFVALLAAMVLGEKLSIARMTGLSLILAGAIVIVGWHATEASEWRTVGQMLFLGAAFCWACFTVVFRLARLEPLHAAALVALGSSITYLPLYFALHGLSLAHVPIKDLAIQAVYQGVLVTIVALVLLGRSIEFLGASGGAAFMALVPAMSALFAIPLLDEWPGTTDWIGIALISVGVYLASGGPLPGRKFTGAAA